MNAKRTLALAAIIAISPLNSALTDEAVPMVSLQRLSLETVLSIAKASIEECRTKGYQISVTVVDRDGTVQVTLRDTIAAPITARISRQKAFTAANFNAATSQLKARADTPIGRIDGFIMSAGGLPIQVGGALMGGVGVSGAPTGETDEECAQAGIDKVIDDLEMAL